MYIRKRLNKQLKNKHCVYLKAHKKTLKLLSCKQDNKLITKLNNK